MSQNENVVSIANRVTYHPEGRIALLQSLSLSDRSAVFNLLRPSTRQAVLSDMSFNEVVELIDQLDPRRAHHILSAMPDKKRQARIVKRLKSDLYEKTEFFLQFHPRATVSLLHLNYLFLSENTTIGDTASIIEDHLRDTGQVPVVLVSAEGKLVGQVPYNILVKERNTTRLKKYLTPIASVKYSADKQAVLDILSRHQDKRVVILDNDESVIGVVFTEEIRDLLNEEPAASLYTLSGVEPSERPFDEIKYKVRNRYQWLIVNLATCFLAGFTVSLFGATLDEIVVLAMFMPIIAGMGGNAATQTLAVMVRGLATGEISLKNSKPALFREMGAGLVNGLIVGAVLIPTALLFGVAWPVVLVAFFAVVANLVISGFFGGFIPVLLKHFGKDPATSATVFITTGTDVVGYLLLFGLATIFLL